MGWFGSLFSGSKSAKPHKAVLDVKRMTMQEVYGQWLHEERMAGDLSHTDADKSHLNERFGYNDHDSNPYYATKEYIKDKSLRIDKRNVKPVTAILLSASPEFFDNGKGGWDQKKLAAWTKASSTWLGEEFGEDLVHMSLHLDEKTPHIHAKVVPTYEKTTKRGKTRQVSHNNHPAFKGPKSYYRLWDRYAAAVAPLGIERGAHTPPEARVSNRAAKQWLRDVARKWSGRAETVAVLDEREKRIVKREEKLTQSVAHLEGREASLIEREAVVERREQCLLEQASLVPGKEARDKLRADLIEKQREAKKPAPVEAVKRVEQRARRSKTLKGKAPVSR